MGFKEGFRVLGKGDDYFFLTDTGRLFVARKAAKGKQRSVVPVWADADRPIEAFITDADANRTFLFLGVRESGRQARLLRVVRPPASSGIRPRRRPSWRRRSLAPCGRSSTWLVSSWPTRWSSPDKPPCWHGPDAAAESVDASGSRRGRASVASSDALGRRNSHI